MKNRIKALALALVVVLPATVLLCTLAPGLNQGFKPVFAESQQPGGGKIVVTGTASVKVTPDMATITMGVRTNDVDAKNAQKENSDTMNRVIESIKALGIAEKDIRTGNFSMYPTYDYQKGTENITGYMVDNSVTVTIKDVSLVGDVVDAGVGAGANTASSINFSVSNSAPYYEQALKQAVGNAKSKASVIADALGVTISNPTEIIEQGSYYPVQAYSMNNMSYDAAMGATPISPGSIEITANVSATYGY